MKPLKFGVIDEGSLGCLLFSCVTSTNLAWNTQCWTSCSHLYLHMEDEAVIQSSYWLPASYIFNEGIKYLFRKHKSGLKWCLLQQLMLVETQLNPHRWTNSTQGKLLEEWCHSILHHPRANSNALWWAEEKKNVYDKVTFCVMNDSQRPQRCGCHPFIDHFRHEWDMRNAAVHI